MNSFAASEDRQMGHWKTHETPHANELMLTVGLLISDCLFLASLAPRSSSGCLALEPSNALDAFRAA